MLSLSLLIFASLYHACRTDCQMHRCRAFTGFTIQICTDNVDLDGVPQPRPNAATVSASPRQLTLVYKV